jgi:hypothetical protein
LTVRKYCYIDGKPPAWWNPYYDLSTEFHLFAADYKRRQRDNLPNRWIIKPAQGTRGLGHRIVDSTSDGLVQAAMVAPILPDHVLLAMGQVKNFKSLQILFDQPNFEITPYDGSAADIFLTSAHFAPH